MKKISPLEFYLTYCHDNNDNIPVIRDIDRHFFDLIEHAKKNGKQLIVSRTRRYNPDAYIYSLKQICNLLLRGQKIAILTQDPDKYVNDLKVYFNVNTEYKQSTINKKPSKGCYLLSLKK